MSTAPVFTENGFAPRHVILRVYAAWNGSSYTVLPGGLTRVSSQSQDSLHEPCRCSLAAEAKIRGCLAESVRRLLRAVALTPPKAKAPRVAARELPSRVADNLFWLGRYTERVESRVRLRARVAAHAVGRRGLWPCWLSRNRDPPSCRIGVPAARDSECVARRAAMAGTTLADGNDLRPVADVEPALEPQGNAAGRVASEGEALDGHVACAAATGSAVLAGAAGERRASISCGHGSARRSRS